MGLSEGCEMKRIICLLALIMVVSGCAFLGSPSDPHFAAIKNNKRNLQKIKIGMSEKKVMRMMGIKEWRYSGFMGSLIIVRSPTKKITYIFEDGQRLDAIYYYTSFDVVKSMNNPRNLEFNTPIIFENNQVIAIGDEQLQMLLEKRPKIEHRLTGSITIHGQINRFNKRYGQWFVQCGDVGGCELELVIQCWKRNLDLLNKIQIRISKNDLRKNLKALEVYNHDLPNGCKLKIERPREEIYVFGDNQELHLVYFYLPLSTPIVLENDQVIAIGVAQVGEVINTKSAKKINDGRVRRLRW